MTTRLPIVALCALLLAITSGCTSAYKNAGVCKQKMIATYPDSEPPLSFDRTGVAHKGSRVVVEATYAATVKSLETKPVKNGEIKTVKATRVKLPAAVECTFQGETLDTFRWLAPEKFARVYDPVPEGGQE